MVDRSAIASDISSPTNDVYKRSPLFHPSQPPLPFSRCSFPGYLFTVERAGLLGRIRTILDAGPPSPRPPLPSPPLSFSLSLFSVQLRWRLRLCVVGGRPRPRCIESFSSGNEGGYMCAHTTRRSLDDGHYSSPGAESSSVRLTGTARYC